MKFVSRRVKLKTLDIVDKKKTNKQNNIHLMYERIKFHFNRLERWLAHAHSSISLQKKKITRNFICALNEVESLFICSSGELLANNILPIYFFNYYVS